MGNIMLYCDLKQLDSEGIRLLLCLIAESQLYLQIIGFYNIHDCIIRVELK